MKKLVLFIICIALSIANIYAQTWNTTGNTALSTDFLGTVNNVNLTIKRNNVNAGFLGINNVSFGVSSLQPSSTGTYNSAYGSGSLTLNSSGIGNSAFGANSLTANLNGNYNCAFGYNTLSANGSGSNNSAYGVGVLQNNTSGSFNCAYGYLALNLNVGGSQNSAFGYRALEKNTGQYNLAFGSLSLPNNTSGEQNIGIGANTLVGNTTSSRNIAVGTFALYRNTDGQSNISIGANSMQNNTIGTNNVTIGTSALVGNTEGSSNTVIGNYAGTDLTVGNNNVFLGLNAGNGITTGESNTIIGSNTAGFPTSFANSVVIANGAGNIRFFSSSAGNTGIGNFSPTLLPTAILEVKSPTINKSGLKFTSLTQSSPVSASNGVALSVDGTGNVILVNSTSGGSSGSSSLQSSSTINVSGNGSSANPYIMTSNIWSLNSGTGNIQNINTGKILLGNITNSSPDYKLFVEKGILTEKVKVAMQISSNWADYVFDKNYKLSPLKEVEEYIFANKHLPGVASAEQLVKEGGIDVNQMFAKQMEKIEELTLYIIELNKKIEKMENENATSRQKYADTKN